ncbi:MAG TPA: integrase core domain-containing protein [Candidatus Dormibacteraeota bacterium]|nr:integrase core domain-containing protein [Candidatus Dormibacteraeota bacterium]
MKTGTQTRTGVVIPGLSSVKPTTTLSKAAKQHLGWVDYYHAHGSNARLTCRHYGIAHRTFYRYYNRFKQQGMLGLEARSQRPHKVRQPTTPRPVINAVKQLRTANPEYSKYKLAVILKRDYGYSVSASTVGRVISKYDLFFTPPVKPKGHPDRLKSAKRLRKPKDFTATKPGDLVEVDVKHLPNMSQKRYAFVAVDVVSKQVAVHVGSTISSKQGALAWKKAVYRLGLPKAALTDNGSENVGAFTELLKTQPTEHYWARPRQPKDKPHVERFIGSLERECLQWGGVATDLVDQQDIINQWLNKYHSYRPHQSLNYLTPDAYLAKLQAEEVALM